VRRAVRPASRSRLVSARTSRSIRSDPRIRSAGESKVKVRGRERRARPRTLRPRASERVAAADAAGSARPGSCRAPWPRAAGGSATAALGLRECRGSHRRSVSAGEWSDPCSKTSAAAATGRRGWRARSMARAARLVGAFALAHTAAGQGAPSVCALLFWFKPLRFARARTLVARLAQRLAIQAMIRRVTLAAQRRCSCLLPATCTLLRVHLGQSLGLPRRTVTTQRKMSSWR
jgi:hypothetical protein